MTPDELADVKERVCGEKSRMGRHAAMSLAQHLRARGKRIGAYHCPFCRCWHVGHIPSMESVSRIAQAIRTLGGDDPGPPIEVPESEPVETRPAIMVQR